MLCYAHSFIFPLIISIINYRLELVTQLALQTSKISIELHRVVGDELNNHLIVSLNRIKVCSYPLALFLKCVFLERSTERAKGFGTRKGKAKVRRAGIGTNERIGSKGRVCCCYPTTAVKCAFAILLLTKNWNFIPLGNKGSVNTAGKWF